MSDNKPDLRTFISGAQRWEFRRGEVGYLLLELLEQSAARKREWQADAYAEGFEKCANWWEIHHYQQVASESNPYRADADA